MLRRSLAVSLVLAACAGAPSADSAMTGSLEHTSWTLVTLDYDPVLASTAITLTFEAGQLAGSAGVNRYLGAWTVEDGELQISRVGATRMAGPAMAQHQERRYLAVLEKVTGFTISDGALALTIGGRPALLFESRP